MRLQGWIGGGMLEYWNGWWGVGFHSLLICVVQGFKVGL